MMLDVRQYLTELIEARPAKRTDSGSSSLQYRENTNRLSGYWECSNGSNGDVLRIHGLFVTFPRIEPSRFSEQLISTVEGAVQGGHRGKSG